jgi:hypothetical protein
MLGYAWLVAVVRHDLLHAARAERLAALWCSLFWSTSNGRVTAKQGPIGGGLRIILQTLGTVGLSADR